MGCGASKVEPQKNERKFSVHAERTTDKRSNGHTNGVNIGAVLNPIESSARKDAILKPQITEINGNVLVDSTDTSDNRRQSSSNGGLFEFFFNGWKNYFEIFLRTCEAVSVRN